MPEEAMHVDNPIFGFTSEKIQLAVAETNCLVLILFNAIVLNTVF
mgnify:CR=1 FL=1